MNTTNALDPDTSVAKNIPYLGQVLEGQHEEGYHE